MNEFNVPPVDSQSTESQSTNRGKRGRAPARASSSNPGVEPTTAPPPPPPPFNERPQRRDARSGRFTDQTSNKENAMNCSNKTRTGLSLLGGAGLGAVLMYLLDPEEGQARRTTLTERAGTAKDTTAAVFAAAMEVAREKGKDVAEVLSEKLAELGTSGAETANSLGAGASSFASRLADRASETSHRLGKTSRHYTESARDSIGSPRSWFGREEKHSYVPSTGSALGAVAFLAAGFGLMYLLDPSQGRRRRAVARDKTMSFLNEVGDFSRRTGRHWANKSKGYAHDTMSAARGMVGEDSTLGSLTDRIRSRIGALGRGQNVSVECDDCGNVTLSGECPADDVMILVTEIQAVPGVETLDNRMSVRDGTAAGLGQ